ncbi:ABC transporter ATP-binding protein [Aquisalimonas asiatica]|uniref:Peptide/nickel transport system ATP-binding protein n=1 Tax=Aquisalimonas asiatica TaxID=406100 RepID=A0A1H8PYS0_9GAMM|nr:ABC transporter ATP-binding protein [Aquisalimonas asiatica]SEO47162.1 peptide/nickel transport system ATP-binding protein [Aquisalimonas asiatica]
MSQAQRADVVAAEPGSAEPILAVQDLTVTAGEGADVLLDGVSLTLAPGEMLGIGGGGGAGKTVLCKALINWLPGGVAVREGEVTFRGATILTPDGAPTTGFRGAGIGYVGADATSALDPTLPVGDQIIEKLRASDRGLSRREAAERVLTLFREVRLPTTEKRMNEYPGQYSGGMMQRAMIVDALVTRPAVVLADDITQPLDVTVAVQIIHLLKQLSAKYGTAVIFASGSLPLLSRAVDRVVVLDRGRIIESGPTEAVIRAPEHAHTRHLLDVIPRVWEGHEPVAGPRARRGPVLSLDDVHRTYRVRERGSFNRTHDVRAVRGVSLDVWEGEKFGIIGESGCGKSTLTRLLTALEQPDQGAIHLNGRRLSTLDPLEVRTMRKDLQLVLQDPFNALPPRRTVGEIIEEPLRIHRLGNREARRAKVLSVMEEVGLAASWFQRLPAGMGGGERQRVNVARALVLEPSVLILDETLTALDVVEQKKLLDLFDTLQQSRALTYIFISHDLAMIRNTCDRIAVMYLGEVVEVAENEQLFRHPVHPYSRALLSAVPTIEPSPFDPAEHLLDGEPPSPIDLPKGCCFRSRCPSAMARCAEEAPAMYQGRVNQYAACFLCENRTT